MNKCLQPTSGNILNNSQLMVYDRPTGQLRARFDNLKLQTIARDNNKIKMKSVMDESFWLLFQALFKVGDFHFIVWVSLWKQQKKKINVICYYSDAFIAH